MRQVAIHFSTRTQRLLATLLLMLPLDGADSMLLAPGVLLQDVVVVVDGRRRGRDAVRLDDVDAAAVVVVLDAVRVGADLDHRLHGHGIAVEILCPKAAFEIMIREQKNKSNICVWGSVKNSIHIPNSFP